MLMLCMKCKNEPADRGMSWGPECDLTEVNRMRAKNGLSSMTREQYDKAFPTDAERAAKAKEG